MNPASWMLDVLAGADSSGDAAVAPAAAAEAAVEDAAAKPQQVLPASGATTAAAAAPASRYLDGKTLQVLCSCDVALGLLAAPFFSPTRTPCDFSPHAA
jgi:hypothetical protein